MASSEAISMILALARRGIGFFAVGAVQPQPVEVEDVPFVVDVRDGGPGVIVTQ